MLYYMNPWDEQPLNLPTTSLGGSQVPLDLGALETQLSAYRSAPVPGPQHARAASPAERGAMDRAWWASAFAIVAVMGGGVVGMVLYVLSVTH